MSIKILKKIIKKIFFVNFFNKFTKQFLCDTRMYNYFSQTKCRFPCVARYNLPFPQFFVFVFPQGPHYNNKLCLHCPLHAAKENSYLTLKYLFSHKPFFNPWNSCCSVCVLVRVTLILIYHKKNNINIWYDPNKWSLDISYMW